jgi:hypothetical protein
MTLSNYIQVCSYAAQISRVIAEAVQYNMEREVATDSIAGRVNTIAKYSILTLEFVRCLPLDLEARKQLLKAEALLRGTKALTGFTTDSRPFLEQSSTLSEVAALARNEAEYRGLQSLELAKLSSEELALKKWPIYSAAHGCCDDYEPPKVIGWKSKTFEEIQTERKGIEGAANLYGVIETALRGLAIHEEFTRTGAIPALAIVEPGPEAMFDFLRFNTIPEELHNDCVLSQYCDSITLIPIRFAVTHQRHPQVLYERASIQAHINRELARGVREPLCPLTRDTITIADLMPSPAAQAIIDARLQSLSDRLRAQFGADLDAAVAAMP